MSSTKLVFVVAFVIAVALADLPVHCEFEQVKGLWTFNLTDATFTKDNIFQTCDYFSDITTTHAVTLSLQGPNMVVDLSSGAVGHWTLLQDQGFELVIFGKRYLAFFSYKTLENKTVVSECQKTLTGWYHADDVNVKSGWGCFKASKSAASNDYENVAYPLSTMRQQFFTNDEQYVQQINSKQKSWTATTYDFLEGKPMNELVSPFLLNMPTEKRHVSSKLQRTSSINGLPEVWDWRNVSNVNYVPPVRDQGKCGSCFSFAGTGMLASRVRIATQNQKQAVFSPQDIVSCSRYSQGCHGGDAYLVAKYAQDFGVISEQCDPYVGQDTQCTHKCPDDNQRQFVSQYTYVGNYYGNTTAENMMEAIANRGPVTIGYYVYRDFFYYKSGVYHHVPTDEELNGSPDPHYEPTGHAVLVVGYGVTEQGEKYWVCQNSWSSNWGLMGYFLIRRGTDESNCESKAVEATLFF